MLKFPKAAYHFSGHLQDLIFYRPGVREAAQHCSEATALSDVSQSHTRKRVLWRLFYSAVPVLRALHSWGQL